MKIYSSTPIQFKMILITLIVCLSWSFSFQALAEDNVILLSSEHLSQGGYVSDSELERMRGGFILPNGIEVDFSIQKIVYINGVETKFFDFQLPENSTISGLRAGNLDLNGFGLGSFIQNNLDNQVITSINTINLGISNLKNSALKNTPIDTRVMNFR